MQFGSRGDARTHMSRAFPDRVDVRGLDLVGDLMGKVTFTEYFHLLLTGRRANADECFFLDLLLVAVAEHGMMPTNVAARMTLDAEPTSLQCAVAAGILGCGTVFLGTVESCARLLERTHARVRSGETVAAAALAEAQAARAAKTKLPGFGHPVHRPVDPRAERILELATERGVVGAYVDLVRALREACASVWPQPLTLNASLPMAAVLLELGYPPAIFKGIPILARTAGLIAHLSEEQEQPIGFLMAARAEEAIAYDPGGRPTDALKRPPTDGSPH
jgi:citrate synthase